MSRALTHRAGPTTAYDPQEPPMPYVCHVLGLAALTLLAAAPSAAAGDAWSVVPATGGTDGRPYIYAEGESGTVLEDAVSVLNPGGTPLTVRLRGADDPERVRSGPVGTGAWIGFARTTGGHRRAASAVSVTVPARTRADVPFTVRVPPGTTPGDHPGAIVAEAGGRSTAVRVRLRVGGPTLSALTVEHVSVGGGRISYELVNRGNTVLAPSMAVHVDGLFGPLLDRPARTLSLDLPPGRRVTLSEPWRGAPALDAVQVRLTVTAAGGARDSASASARFVPWGAVAGTGGALAAAGAGLVVRRRGRGPRDGDAAPWRPWRPWRRGCRPPGGDAGEPPRTEAELTGAVK
ncbi:COG1470 family protein [Streptomyces avermitilis]|uniref:COG1470 family protein n=1 Tax=Streptomyces avermitilis TaxID=33903 RepID=UPI00339E8E9F